MEAGERDAAADRFYQRRGQQEGAGAALHHRQGACGKCKNKEVSFLESITQEGKSVSLILLAGGAERYGQYSEGDAVF